jgi:hypothetical protein
MRQSNGDFTAKEWRAVLKYPSLKGDSAKRIYNDMSATLGDKRPSYCTVKSWVAGFRTARLSTEDEERSGRPTQVTVPQKVDAIHSRILGDRRISAKKIPETRNSRILGMRKCQPNVSMLIRSVIECLLHRPSWLHPVGFSNR